jgi:hypothetical protein
LPTVLIVALIVVITLTILQPAINSEAQTKKKEYSTSSLFVAIFSNGDTLIEQDIVADPKVSKTNITLFGRTIEDLNVADYNNNLIHYNSSGVPGKITLTSSGVSKIRLTYVTPDLVSKDGRVWTFSINSADKFSLKLPANSTITDLGKEFPESVRRMGDQELLSFQPGNIEIKYVIGFLGTKDQSNASIESAGLAIKDAKNRYPGIILDAAEKQLRQAIISKNSEMYLEAERYATDANDLALRIARDYSNVRTTIMNTNNQIKKAAASGEDITLSKILLSQSNSEFSRGQYIEAKRSADNAVVNIGKKMELTGFMPIIIIIIVVTVLAVAIWYVFFVKKRKNILILSLRRKWPKLKAKSDPSLIDNSQLRGSDTEIKGQNFKSEYQGSTSDSPTQSPLGSYSASSFSKNSLPSSPAYIDQKILSDFIAKLLMQRPYLRPEDQQVLKYLEEKEGAAFESEIRNKLQLPKTTIWRLVKRLEREDLVEVRKTAGQNLIKLRFEDRSDK